MDSKNRKQAYYISPVVKVVEIKTRQVICGSYDGRPATMGWNVDDGDNWQ